MRSSTTELPPRLMVSVRDDQDWTTALEAGVDIIDVPCLPDQLAGELLVGCQSADFRRDLQPRMIPLGFALDCGELQQWTSACTINIPDQARWARLGLAGCAPKPDWQGAWVRVRQLIEASRSQPLAWWAVAYADHVLAQAPCPREILTAALETHCAGLVLDTFIKSETTLTDLLAPQELTGLMRSAREAHLPVIIAGGIESDDLEWMCDLEPDVIAVRRTVCRLGEHDQPLSPTRLEWFRQSLDEAVQFDREAWQFAHAVAFTASDSH